MTTKGEFLQEKLGNMARWVIGEVGKENLPASVLAGIDGRSALEACLLASTLQANKVMVDQRNWSGLMYLLAKDAPEVQDVVTTINKRPDMHEKFWRYLELFIEISEQQ